MKTITFLALIVAVCKVDATHFVVGNVADRVDLFKHEKVEYNAIPFYIRTKQRFYTVPEHKKIAGIQCLDLLQTHGTVNLTTGGVGFTYVNLQFESERGRGIDYDVGIYVNPDY